MHLENSSEFLQEYWDTGRLKGLNRDSSDTVSATPVVTGEDSVEQSVKQNPRQRKNSSSQDESRSGTRNRRRRARTIKD